MRLLTHLRRAELFMATMASAMRGIIGVPDYERYLLHARRCHPDRVLLSPEAFARDVLARRYTQPGSRCC